MLNCFTTNYNKQYELKESIYSFYKISGWIQSSIEEGGAGGEFFPKIFGPPIYFEKYLF